MEGGREDGKEGGRGGGADTELKTKTPHVNVGNKEHCTKHSKLFCVSFVCFVSFVSFRLKLRFHMTALHTLAT